MSLFREAILTFLTHSLSMHFLWNCWNIVKIQGFNPPVHGVYEGRIFESFCMNQLYITCRAVYLLNLYNTITILAIRYDTWTIRLRHFDSLAYALHRRSTRQFLAIFIHPGHFQNGSCHRCNNFCKSDWFISKMYGKYTMIWWVLCIFKLSGTLQSIVTC